MPGNNAALLHEGGTTSAIATYSFFTAEALSRRSDKVFLIKNGWEDLSLAEELKEGEHYFDFSKTEINPRKRKTPIDTSRFQPVPTPNKPRDYTDNIIKHLKSLGVRCLVTKGGDDERWIDAYLAEPLRREGIQTIPLPKGIDLDLITETIHDDVLVSDTPGARSAIINISSDPKLNNLKHEAQDTGRIFTVEVMGRNCGELSLATAYKLDADFCIIPEKPMTKKRIERFMNKVEEGNVIVVAEGSTWYNELEGRCTGFYLYRRDAEGNFVPVTDTLGRKKYAKAAEGVAEAIENVTGITTRSQLTGYASRSGPPCEGDIEYERVLGLEVLRLIDEEKTGYMPAPAKVVPPYQMSRNMHEVELPSADLGYKDLKKRVIQKFDAQIFYNEEEFTWTPEFERLIDTMLSAD